MAIAPTRPATPGSLLVGLTEAQRHAVTCDDAPLCVVAAAGSGKTTVLARRVARRVLDGSATAERSLVVTFTRKAGGELRDRLGRLGMPGRVAAGTFHAVALAQLRRHWADRGRPPAALVDDPARIVQAVLGQAGDRVHGQSAAVLGELHWAQVRMVGPGDYAGAASVAGRAPPPGLTFDEVADAYDRYVAEKRRRGVLDLDDLITRCAAVLEDDPSAAAAQRWRVRHLFVDEFQDVNPAQWRLLMAWLGEGRDLFVVGDPRQAIYSWNGADPSLLDRLPSLLPGTTVVPLGDNHRSTPQVVEAARAVLGGHPGRASRPDGPWPVVEGFDDDGAEAAAVARWVRRVRRPGHPWGRLAVLARTNARLEPVAHALSVAGIPFRMAPGTTPAARWGGVLAELRRLPDDGPLRSALAEMVVGRESRRHDAAGADADPTSPGPPSPGALPAALARLADEHALEFPEATVGEFLEWLTAGGETDLALDAVDGVELATFHRAKGLEWPAVAVVGLEDGMVPIAYAVTPDAVAEERRLLYVALTRAEDDLWCSWARTRRAGSRTWRCRPSPLLAAVEDVAVAGRPVVDTDVLASRVASLRAQLPDVC